ncbi:MAG: class I SAM-dependent methyltransferase [Thermodesulfobacteriota bacterium]
MCAHKFDPNKCDILDDPARWERENPDQIWDVIGLQDARVVVDLGAGTGFFAFHFVRKLEPGVQVCAFDISLQMLDKLKSNKGDGFSNVQPVQTGEAELPLKSGCVDLFYMSNLHHELDDRKRVLQEAYRVLSPGGKLAVWDWKKQDMEYGPPTDKRISGKVIENELSKQGFADVVFHDILTYHNLFTASKR